MPDAPGQGMNSELVGHTALAALRTRTLGSSYFADADRMKQLLSYLVDEEIAGRGEKLSVYGVAFDVFNRSSDFDPQKNSVVRVEMHRLRQLLDAWANDPRNPDAQQIRVEPGQYRPSVAPRHMGAGLETTPGTDRADRHALVRRRGLMTLGVAIALMMGGFGWNYVNRAADCRSERPQLTIPTTIPGLDDQQLVTMFLGRVDQFLSYYSLLDAAHSGPDECTGAPRYGLSLSVIPQANTPANDLLQATVTDLGTERVIWQLTYPFDLRLNPFRLSLLASQLVTDIAADSGAVPARALQARWDNKAAREEYRCVMSAEQYYTTIPPLSDWPGVRECLIDHYQSSNHADVSGFLASIEIEARYAPQLQQIQTRNYYKSAIARGRALDRRNLQVLIAMLRYNRTRPTVDPTEVNALARVLANDYPFSPDAQYQVSYAQAALLGQYDDAIRHNRIATLLSPQRYEPNLVLIYTHLARGEIEKIRPYIPLLELDFYVISHLIALHFADATGDTGLRDRTLNWIGNSPCHARACLEAQLTSGEFHRDISAPLLRTVERHFPA